MRCVNVLLTYLHIYLDKTWHKYSPCERALLKGFSASDVSD